MLVHASESQVWAFKGYALPPDQLEVLGAACSGASEAAPWSTMGGLLRVRVRDPGFPEFRFCLLVHRAPKKAREKDGRIKLSVHGPQQGFPIQDRVQCLDYGFVNWALKSKARGIGNRPSRTSHGRQQPR